MSIPGALEARRGRELLLPMALNGWRADMARVRRRTNKPPLKDFPVFSNFPANQQASEKNQKEKNFEKEIKKKEKSGVSIMRLGLFTLA